jgi:hypothetical protein
MTRFVIFAILAAVPATALVGCGGDKPEAPAAAPAQQLPDASEMFDKKGVPPVKQGKPADPG